MAEYQQLYMTQPTNFKSELIQSRDFLFHIVSISFTT